MAENIVLRGMLPDSIIEGSHEFEITQDGNLLTITICGRIVDIGILKDALAVDVYRCEEDDEPFEQILLDAPYPCVQCNQVILSGDTSTFCGSLHRDCLVAHMKECEICGKDDGLRTELEPNERAEISAIWDQEEGEEVHLECQKCLHQWTLTLDAFDTLNPVVCPKCGAKDSYKDLDGEEK